MMAEYSKNKVETVDSFSGYKDSLKIDPVYRYLNLVYPEGWENKESNLSYLSNLFYRVKGTSKVIDLLVSFGILGSWEEPVGEASYNGRRVEVYVPSISFDRDLYCTYLKEFLENLLFFDHLKITVGEITVEVEDTDSTPRIEHNTFNYRIYEG